MQAMQTNSTPAGKNELEERRRAARKTALKLAVLALLIFAAFLYTGIAGRG